MSAGTAVSPEKKAVVAQNPVVAEAHRHSITEINQLVGVPKEIINWLTLAVEQAEICWYVPTDATPGFGATEAARWIRVAADRCVRLRPSPGQQVRFNRSNMVMGDLDKFEISMVFLPNGQHWVFYGDRMEFCVFAGTVKN